MISRPDRLANRANDADGETHDWVGKRFDLDTGHMFLRKMFPAEDSFLLGEVAPSCLLLFVLTGIFFGTFFKPSMSGVEYKGSVAKF